MTREFAILKAANDYRDAENMIDAVLVALRELSASGFCYRGTMREPVERWYDLAWDAQSIAKLSLLAFAMSA